jgi:hypothetical protein
MSGRLNYDVPNHTIRIDDFDYAIDTGNPVVSTGEVILHDAIRDSIATRLDLQIGTFIDRLPTMINKAVSRSRAGKTIDLTIDSLAIRKCEIRMGRDNVYLLVNATAKNSLRIKKIKSGKLIRISKVPSRHDAGESRQPRETGSDGRATPDSSRSREWLKFRPGADQPGIADPWR